MGAKSLTMGMADGAGGSGCRKHARRGSQGPFDDDDARSAVRPRSETSVVMRPELYEMPGEQEWCDGDGSTCA